MHPPFEKGGGTLDAADEILLADGHAVVAQDVVGGGDMEIKVRQAGVVRVVQAGVFALGVAAQDDDVAGFRAGEFFGRKGAEEVDGLGDAGLVFGQRGFVVFEARHVHVGQAGADAFGEVAGDLDLPAEREHVGRQAGAEDVADVAFERIGMGLGFVQAGVEGFQAADENRNGGVEQGGVHGNLQSVIAIIA